MRTSWGEQRAREKGTHGQAYRSLMEMHLHQEYVLKNEIREMRKNDVRLAALGNNENVRFSGSRLRAGKAASR
jgi:hypothetical protein